MEKGDKAEKRKGKKGIGEKRKKRKLMEIRVKGERKMRRSDIENNKKKVGNEKKTETEGEEKK